MMLSGKEIEREHNNGRIYISDFNPSRINPNSYNLRLADEILMYCSPILDMKKENQTKKITIPESGLILFPGTLYLGRTHERTNTDSYISRIVGRSSIGRLGLSVHITADFGDIGFNGCWTLSMSCLLPVKIYPLVEICQIYYEEIKGEYNLYNSYKYQNNNEVQPSKLYKDFLK